MLGGFKFFDGRSINVLETTIIIKNNNFPNNFRKILWLGIMKTNETLKMKTAYNIW